MQHSCSLQIIGILGMGRSGRAVLQRAEQLGITAHCFDDSQPEYHTHFARRLAMAGRWTRWLLAPAFHINHPCPASAGADGTLIIRLKLFQKLNFLSRTGPGWQMGCYHRHQRQINHSQPAGTYSGTGRDAGTARW